MTSLLKVVFIPPHPFLRPCRQTDQRWLLMIWTTAEGHCGPQHLATASPFPTQFRIRHAGAMGFHLLSSKIYPWMNSLFRGHWTIPGKTHGLLSYLWGFYAPLFQGCKTSYVFQSGPSHVTLFTSKCVHVLRLSSLSRAVLSPELVKIPPCISTE